MSGYGPRDRTRINARCCYIYASKVIVSDFGPIAVRGYMVVVGLITCASGAGEDDHRRNCLQRERCSPGWFGDAPA
jgi:hypothetical protein